MVLRRRYRGMALRGPAMLRKCYWGMAQRGPAVLRRCVEVTRAPGVNRRRSVHKTATHISVDLVIVLFRVDVTCHTSHVTVTRHNVCCI